MNPGRRYVHFYGTCSICTNEWVEIALLNFIHHVEQKQIEYDDSRVDCPHCYALDITVKYYDPEGNPIRFTILNLDGIS